MKIKNWHKLQHFKDRRPPWIKLYRDILDDPDWHSLSGDDAKILTMIWLIASEDENQEGNIPDVRKLSFRLRISESVLNKALNRLSHWLIQDDINVISTVCQFDAPETETETETETDNTMSLPAMPKADQVPYQKIVDLYHEVLPKNPRVMDLTATRKGYIAARWKNQLPDLQTWKDFFEFVAQSDFLTGKTDPRPGYRRMNPNLEWLTKEANFIKIAERTYHGKV